MMKKQIQNPQIKATRVYLRYPVLNDSREFIQKSRASKKFHQGLVNPPDDLSKFKEHIKKNNSDANQCFIIIEKETENILGAVNLSQIFYGGFKNAYLGYYLFEYAVGFGYMTEAIKALLNYYFIDLKLHRLEANIQPHNISSIELIRRCGFQKEGFSPKYLKIDGKWCDHERWALIKEIWRNRDN